MVKSRLLVQQRYFLSLISNVSNNKNELKKKLLGQQFFKTSQFYYVLIFFKFVRPCLLFSVLCCLYLLYCFELLFCIQFVCSSYC